MAVWRDTAYSRNDISATRTWRSFYGTVLIDGCTCHFLLVYQILMMSNRYAVLDASTRRKQDADDIKILSEKRKPVTMAKNLTKQKSSSLASPKNKSYLDALQDEGKALSEKRKLVAKAKTLTKYKSSALASQGATSSSSAPVSPSASASDLQAEVLVKNVNPFDSSNDLDPASQYHKKSATDVATGIDQESVDIGLKTKSKSGGVSRKEEEKLKNVESLVLHDGEIKRECLGSESEYSKKFSKECLENLYHDFVSSLVSRQVFAEFRVSEEGRIVDARIKKELKLLAVKSDMFFPIVDDVPYFRMLTLMSFQAANTSLKANFSDRKWRITRRFPRSCPSSYYWWYQSFDPEIARKRLEIMEEAAKITYPSLEYYKLCVSSSSLNSFVHPPVDLEYVTKMAMRKKFVIRGVDLGPTLSSIKSGGS